MLRWRPGDRVKVRSADRIILYGNMTVDFNQWYGKWAEKIVTIGGIDGYGDGATYFLEGTSEERNLWIDDSFEDYPVSDIRFKNAETIPEYDSII